MNGPRGLAAGTIQHRLASDGDAGPITFDRKSRTVDAVLSKGSPVQRFYGTETLRISRDAIDLSRVNTNSVPLLDSHNQIGIASALGRITRAWIDGDALMGKLKFNQTPQGELAMGMVERGEISSLSAGYRVDEWLIRDEDGEEVAPDSAISWDDKLSFEATRWQLLEGSLTLLPADSSASIRSLGGSNVISDIRARMYARQEVADIRARMMSRQAMYDRQLEMLGNYDD